ncbi:MAG: endonuclease/exonuclease/phosphatase family protein [Patescibacteria group bacterium]
MKIITLNIWDLPLWFVRDRKERIRRIGAYLNTLDADIICLQESFDPRHRRIINALLKRYENTDANPQDRNVFFTSFDTTGGCVTFSKFPILKTLFIPFSGSFFSPIEFFSRKGALITLINTPYGILRVVNTHLYQKSFLFDTVIRFRQMEYLFAYLRADESLSTIIAGDFNEHDLINNLQFLTLMRNEHFFHPKTDRWDPTYRKDNPYVMIWMNMIADSKRFDYILHNGLDLLKLRTGRYEVMHSAALLSDHDPVMLVLKASL